MIDIKNGIWGAGAGAKPTDEQPAPVANSSTPIADLVIADIHERVAVGLQRYGTKLQAHNGRDALADAYQEALDQTMYIRQAIAERESTLDAAVAAAGLTDFERSVIDRCIDRLLVLRADISAGRSHGGGRCALDEALLTELADVRVERGRAEARPTTTVCAICNDTHMMTLGDREVMCTHCPTPCGCACHRSRPIRVVIDDGEAPDETGEAGA